MKRERSKLPDAAERTAGTDAPGAADLSALLSYWLWPKSTEPSSILGLSDAQLNRLVQEAKSNALSKKQSDR